MALSLRFTGLKWDKDHCTAIPIPGEVPWRGVSREDTRFRKLSISAGYLDLFAVLSPEEAIEIIKRDYESLVAMWMEHDPNSTSAKDLEQMRAALRSADIIVAHVYEWESGLNE